MEKFRQFFPNIFADKAGKELDVWYQFSVAVAKFNEICKKLICGS